MLSSNCLRSWPWFLWVIPCEQKRDCFWAVKKKNNTLKFAPSVHHWEGVGSVSFLTKNGKPYYLFYFHHRLGKKISPYSLHDKFSIFSYFCCRTKKTSSLINLSFYFFFSFPLDFPAKQWMLQWSLSQVDFNDWIWGCLEDVTRIDPELVRITGCKE